MEKYITNSTHLLNMIKAKAAENPNLTVLIDGPLFTPYFSKYVFVEPKRPVGDISGMMFLTMNGVFVNSIYDAIDANHTNALITVSDFSNAAIHSYVFTTNGWDAYYTKYCMPYSPCGESLLLRMLYTADIKENSRNTLKDDCCEIDKLDECPTQSVLGMEWFTNALNLLCNDKLSNTFIEPIYNACVDGYNGSTCVANLLAYLKYFKRTIKEYGRQYRHNCLRNTLSLLKLIPECAPEAVTA